MTTLMRENHKKGMNPSKDAEEEIDTTHNIRKQTHYQKYKS